jgi:hypothetical protein
MLQIIETIESKEQPFSKLPKAQQELIWTLSGSVIGVTSSLAEAQEEIVQAISKIPVVINFLFGLLTFDSVPAELFGDSLFCLAALTEDNEHLAKKIIDHRSWLDGLMQLREHKGFKAVAACGVLHNIFSTMEWWDHATPIDGFSDACLISTLVQSMDQAEPQQGLANGSGHSSPDHVLKLALEIIASIATNLQEGLEHASGTEEEFKGFDEVSEDADEEMMEDDFEMEENKAESKDMGSGGIRGEEMDADMGFVNQDEEQPSKNQPTLDALVHSATPKILTLSRSLFEVSEEHKAIKTSALSALNNISWTISSIDFAAGNTSISKVWAALAQCIWSEVVWPVLSSNTADICLASSITSIAWAVARSTHGKLELQGDEQKKFMALYQASKGFPPADSNESNKDGKSSDPGSVDVFQSLSVKCIGVLGRLALHPAPIPLNREIGIFLLTALARLPETPTADCVEALNQIYDIYDDKEHEFDQAVFWSDGFYNHLEEIVPKVKKMAKSIDKRKKPELRERADEALLNLGRFLAYKKKERDG